MVFGLAQAALADTPTKTVAPLIISGRQSTRPPGSYSAGITEIIRMLDAKIDAPVILAYIQNSPIAYNPDATELIALKQHGASTEMLTALLHHGDELRLQMAQPQSAANAPPAGPPYGYAPANGYVPANDYAPESAYSPYPYDFGDSTSAAYPATEYGHTYGWPLVYWRTVGIRSYRPHENAHEYFSAPSSGRTTTFAAHSTGSLGSGNSGGRSGGRSR